MRALASLLRREAKTVSVRTARTAMTAAEIPNDFRKVRMCRKRRSSLPLRCINSSESSKPVARKGGRSGVPQRTESPHLFDRFGWAKPVPFQV